MKESSTLLLMVSAPEMNLLREKISRIISEAEAAPGNTRSLVSRANRETLSLAKNESTFRLAVYPADPAGIATLLKPVKKKIDDGENPAEETGGFYCFGENVHQKKSKTAFLFPGQGSQKPGMLRGLRAGFPGIDESFRKADEILLETLGSSLASFVYPDNPEEDKKPENMSRLTQTEIAQPAIAAAGMGVARAMESLGLRCEMTAGHSAGEYPALCHAGVFEECALYRLLEFRGRCMGETAKKNKGAMAAAMADEKKVSSIIGNIDNVFPANLNSPRQTVISGTEPAIREAVAALGKERVKARPLPVSGSFHTPLMQEAAERFAGMVSSLDFHEPRIPVYSNTLGAIFPRETSLFAPLLVRHIVEPVRFVDQVESMYRDGVRIFVETGPGAVLSGLVTRIIGNREVTVASPGKEPEDGEEPDAALWKAVARLFIAGLNPERWPGLED